MIKLVFLSLVFQVVLGLHILRGDNIAIIGEVDEDIDKRWNLSEVRADPIISIVH
jgi:U6 snRNA-associated Sm-like protein LSm8